MIEIFLIVAPLTTLLVVILIMYEDARRKMHGSFTKQNTIEFGNAGEKLIKILPNVSHRVLVQGRTIEESRLKLPSELQPGDVVVKVNWFAQWLRNVWGYFWVSLFYPWRQLHEFKIVKERLRSTTEVKKDADLREMIERDKEPSVVKYLKAQFPRPFFVPDAETKDGFKVSFVISGIFDVVIPYLPAYVYQERFFELLLSVVAAAVRDYVKMYSYNDNPKTKEKGLLSQDMGKNSPFSKFIMKRLLISTRSKKNIIEHLGVTAVDIWVEAFDLAEEPEVVSATKAKEKNRLEGQADFEKAKWDKKSAQERAIGIAAPVTELGKAYAAHGPYANHVNRERVTANLGQGSNISTLVLGREILTTVPVGGATGSGSPPTDGGKPTGSPPTPAGSGAPSGTPPSPPPAKP